MHVQPYLFFEGQAEEALEYYCAKLGAERRGVYRFKDNPEPGHNPPDSDDKLMHGEFQIGDTVVMVSDGRCSGASNFDGFALSVAVSEAADVDRLFNAVAKDGEVVMPAGETFFAKRFGMAKDKFGVIWMFIADKT